MSEVWGEDAMTNEIWGPALKELRTVLSAGAMGTLADGVLLERFLAGRGNADSSAAFAALVARHGPTVLGVCREVLHDLHDAEDASQATFFVLAKKAGSIRRVDSLASWLFGVALRVAHKAKAQGARRRVIERLGVEMKARSGDDGGQAGAAAELFEEVDRLPERYRGPIVLCALEGLTNDQAARELGLPVRTIQRRLAQGRERLRTRLVRRGIDPSIGLMGFSFRAPELSRAWVETTVETAARLAAGREITTVVSASVAVLTEGTLSTMSLGRMKLLVLASLAAGAAVTAVLGMCVAIASRPDADPPARLVETGQVRSNEDRRPDPDLRVGRVGPWIKGLVVDTTGRPVADARVTSLWTMDSPVVMTKADGTFVIPTDEPRLLNQAFLATADNGARQGIFRYDDPSGPRDPRTLARIVLKPARAVTVSVADERGMPVENTAVFLLDLVFPVAQGQTNARGIAVVSAPQDALVQWVFGYKAGVGFDYFENYRSSPAGFSPPPERAALVLNGTRSVRVRAVDSSERPVQGIDIVPITIKKKGKIHSVNLNGSPVRARSDAQGIAVFDWFPPDIEAGTSFLPLSAAYSAPRWPLLDVSKPDAVVTMQVLRLTRIAGRITKPDGSPGARVRVIAEGAGTAYPTGSGRARTAAAGTYSMDLPPEQSYMVYVEDDAWAARSRTGVVVREDKPLAGIDLALEKGSVLRGRVTYGKELRPAPGVAVMLTEGAPTIPKGTFKGQLSDVLAASLRVTDTDAEGRYFFRVAPGEYEINGPAERGVDRRPERLKIGDAQVFEKDFRLARLDRPWKSIRGVVRSLKPDGPPIADAIVVSEPIGVRIPPINGFADSSGRFQMPRIFGRSLFYARDPTGQLAGYAMHDDDDESEVAIVAQPAATARGRVVDSSGKPMGGVDVLYAVVIRLEVPGGFAGAGQSVETGQDGRFSAPGLLVGARCRLFASSSAGAVSRDRNFDVTDSKPVDLGDIVLEPRQKR
jgi:RNA polymerase sigma factor (sigma-70 family)